MGRKKAIIIVVVIVLAGVILLVGASLISRFAPEAILNRVLQDSLPQLEERFLNDPLFAAAKIIDPSGKQTIQVDLRSDSLYLGEVQYNLELQTEPHKLLGEGMIRSEQLSFAVEIYADPQFMAISSDNILSGQYYGITYDTFDADIRSIPLLTWLIGEPVLQSWNSRVFEVKQFMETDYSVPYFPAPDQNNIQNVIFAILATDRDTEKISMEAGEGESECWEIHYYLTEDQLLENLGLLIGADDLTDATASFYITKKRLTKVEIKVAYSDFSRIIRLELGENILTDPIKVEISTQREMAGQCEKIQFCAAMESDEIIHQWDFYTGDGLVNSYTCEYSSDSGELKIRKDGGNWVNLLFDETDDGIRLQSDEFIAFWEALTGLKVKNSRLVSGNIVISRGSNVVTPDYRNLDQWSMEDFLILLEGIGSFLGLNFAV